MASFAKASFDVGAYLSFRPAYPPKIFEIVCAYHALNGGRFDRALDIGCGPGFVALALSSRFKSLTAIDPAQKMVDIDLQPDNPTAPRISYRVGRAEDLSSAGIGSGEDGVDLAIAAQAAHWFDYPRTWRELTRVVRPGGSVVFLAYAEMQFPHHPSLNPLITRHFITHLGPYWSQPGRSITERLLSPTPFPVLPSPNSQRISLSSLPNFFPSEPPPTADDIPEPLLPPLPSQDDMAENGDRDQGGRDEPEFDFDFSSWDPASAVRLTSRPNGDPWLMTKTFTLATLEGYIRTLSAQHDYQAAHPEDAAKRGKGGQAGKEGDLVDRFVRGVAEGLRSDGPTGGEDEGEIVGGWPMVLMMIKKRG